MIVKNIRKYSRHASVEPLSCRIKNLSGDMPESIPGDAINISKSGMSLKLDQMIDPESELIIKIQINEESFVFKGKTVSCLQSTEGHYVCGVHIQKAIKGHDLHDFYNSIDQLVRVDGPHTKTFSVNLNELMQ